MRVWSISKNNIFSPQHREKLISFQWRWGEEKKELRGDNKKREWWIFFSLFFFLTEKLFAIFLLRWRHLMTMISLKEGRKENFKRTLQECWKWWHFHAQFRWLFCLKISQQNLHYYWMIPLSFFLLLWPVCCFFR